MNVLITGASSGIGAALALEAAARNDNLFLCGRNAARLEDVAARCRARQTSPREAFVAARVLDVTDEDDVTTWLAECEARAPLDVVFANAGVSTGEETNANVRNTFAINVGGVVNTVLAALDLLRRRTDEARRSHPPHLVLTASIAGYGPLKACPSYSGTKACVRTWGLALRGMLAAEHIRVSVICPGFIRSRITAQNTCPMPFFMEADKAAQIIWSRVLRNAGLIAFPWPMRFATWLLAILPYRLNELLNRLLPKKVI